MNELPFSPVELYTLALVADADLPAAAWDDILAQLAPPLDCRPDPAPGVEYAPVELPPAVQASVVNRMHEIAAGNPRRKAERGQNPPSSDVQWLLLCAATAEVRRVVREVSDLGVELRAELDEPSSWSR